MKNLIIINDFNYIEGGASKVAIETAQLLKYNYNIYFFSAVNSEKEKIDGVNYIYTNQKEALKENNIILGIINGIYNIKAKKQLTKLLSNLEREETIIHVHGWTKALSSSIFIPIFKYDFQCVLTLHDYFSYCPNGGLFNYNTNKICKLKPCSAQCIKCNCDSRNYFFKLYRLLRIFIQNNIICVNKKIKYLIGISDLNLDLLKSNFPNSRIIKKIRNPVTINDSIKNNNYYYNNYFLYVGRVVKEKGVQLFCEAMKNLNLKGIIVGDGNQRKKLEKEYSENVEFVGWKNSKEVLEYMKNAKALIFPSLWYEGAPLTPLEALGMGLPCIASNCCSAREYENVILFDPYIKGDLENKITNLDKNLKFKKIENNYKIEITNFYEEINNDNKIKKNIN